MRGREFDVKKTHMSPCLEERDQAPGGNHLILRAQSDLKKFKTLATLTQLNKYSLPGRGNFQISEVIGGSSGMSGKEVSRKAPMSWGMGRAKQVHF